MSSNDKPKRFLAPPFIAKLDSWLLKNYPDIWSTRVHLVFYYGLLVYVAFSTICMVMPGDMRNNSHVEFWCTSAGLIGLVGLVFWFVFLFRFNVFKRYGQLKLGDRLRTFLLFHLCLLLITSIVFVPFIADKIKVDAMYTDDEILDDVNQMNYYMALMERDSASISIKADTLVLTDSYDEANEKNVQLRMDRGNPDPSDVHMIFIDTSSARWKLREADSVRQLGSAGYITYDYTNLNVLGSYDYEFNSNDDYRPWGAVYIYNRVFKSTNNIPEAEARKRFWELHDKYAQQNYDSYWDHYDNAPSIDYPSYVSWKYQLSPVRDAIYQVERRKHPFRNTDFGFIALVMVYISMAINLFLFAFRHSTVRTFFFSLLVAVILLILNGVLIAIFNLHEESISSMYLGYYVLFLVLSSTIFTSRRRSLIKGIALNFTLWMTFLVPIVIVTIYDRMTRFQYYYNDYYESHHVRMHDYYVIAQITGGALLLLGVTFVFSKWYRTWYAQPED